MSPTPKKKSNPRSLNWRLLIWTVATLLLISGAAFFAHKRTESSLIETYLSRATEAETNGDFDAAAKYLQLYLKASGTEDSAAIVRMANAVAADATSLTKKLSAIKWYYRAVGIAPKNLEVRSRLAELLMDTGQFSLAEEQASQVLLESPDHHPCLKIKSLSRFGLFTKGRPISLQTITNELRDFNRLHPDDVKVASTLARVFRDHNVPHNEVKLGDTANAVMNALVESNPNHESYLARHHYRVRYGIAGSLEDIKKALELAPDDPGVILAAAQSTRQQKRFDEALGYYQKLIRLDSENSKAHLGIGECLLSMGKTDMAIQAWKTGLEQSELYDLSINVRLADTLINLKRSKEAHAAIQRIQAGVNRLTSQGSESIRDWAVAAHSLISGKYKISQQQYSQAIPLLRRVATTTKSEIRQADDIELTFQAWSLLGQAYWRLQQWEDAAISFVRALELVPNSHHTRQIAAKSWAHAGHIQKAILLAEQSALRDNATHEALLLLLRLRLREQLRIPITERNWSDFKRVLEIAETKILASWEIAIVRTSFLYATQGNSAIGSCMDILLDAERRYPEVPQFWSQLVMTYQMLGLKTEADRALEQFESLSNNSVESLMVRAELFASRSEFEEARKVLNSIQTKNPFHLQQISDAKIKLTLWQGDSTQLTHVLKEQLAQDKDNLHVVAQLAELTFRTQQFDEFQKWLDQIRSIEGKQGSLWRYFEVRSLLANNPDANALSRVFSLFEELDQIRPWWSGTTYLKALIADQKGDPKALDIYRLALQQGLRIPEVYQRVIELLQSKGRLLEAEQYVQLMLQENSPSQTISGIAISAASQRGQMHLAMDLAKKNVELNPKSMLARVWYAKTLRSQNLAAEAEKQLDMAAELSPQDLTVLSAKFAHFVSVGNSEAARLVLKQIENTNFAHEIQKYYVLAQSYQFINDRDKADAYYQKIIELAPQNIEFLIRYAVFLSSKNTRRAEQFAREALKIDPSNDSARRTLALILSSRENPQDWQQARRLLGYLPSQTDSADKRLNAVLLIRRGTDEDLEKAENIAGELTKTDSHTADDFLLLASLQERRKAIEDAQSTFEMLVNNEYATSKHLAAFVEFLLRHDKHDEANHWLVQLESKAPNSLLAVRLRCQWYGAVGEQKKKIPHMDHFADQQLQRIENPADKQQFMLRVAREFITLDEERAAETWYRKLHDAYPGNEQYLAMHWAKTKKPNSAVDLCISSLKKELTPTMTIVLAKVLLFGTNQTEFDESIEAILKEAVKTHDGNSELYFYVANVRLRQGRTEEAIGLYHRLVEFNPKHVLAWNNLAALTAEKPGRLDLAFKYVERAISEAGYNIPILMDTKATILMEQGKHQQAVKILADLVNAPNGNDPRFHLHYCLALHRNGDIKDAKQAFQKAVELGIKDRFLTETEQKWFLSFKKEVL